MCCMCMLQLCVFNGITCPDLEGEFFLMLEEMRFAIMCYVLMRSDALHVARDFYNKQVFSERDVIQPHSGEVVAVYDDKDGYWYRARVIDSNVGSVTVCKRSFWCNAH